MPARMDIALPANNRCGRPVERALRSRSHRVMVPWEPLPYDRRIIPECPIEWIDGRPTEIPLIDIREPDEADGPLGIRESPLGSQGHLGRCQRKRELGSRCTGPLDLSVRSHFLSRCACSSSRKQRPHKSCQRRLGGMMAYRELNLEKAYAEAQQPADDSENIALSFVVPINQGWHYPRASPH